MNLNINQVKAINYTNKELKNNKDNKDNKDNKNEKFCLELENKNFKLEIDERNLKLKLADEKISEEEDKIDYEVYIKSHMMHSAYSFEESQKNMVSFPPNTAPGIVRKTWREQWEKATPEGKEAMESFSNIYMLFLTENKGYKENMSNDLNGYLKLMDDLTEYIELHYGNFPGLEKLYQGLMNVANSLGSELKKYK